MAQGITLATVVRSDRNARGVASASPYSQYFGVGNMILSSLKDSTTLKDLNDATFTGSYFQYKKGIRTYTCTSKSTAAAIMTLVNA